MNEEARQIVWDSMRPSTLGVAQYLDQEAVIENIARALADRDARLARVVEALVEALEELRRRRQYIMAHASFGGSDAFMVEQEERWRAALADAGAGKERGDGL